MIWSKIQTSFSALTKVVNHSLFYSCLCCLLRPQGLSFERGLVSPCWRVWPSHPIEQKIRIRVRLVPHSLAHWQQHTGVGAAHRPRSCLFAPWACLWTPHHYCMHAWLQNTLACALFLMTAATSFRRRQQRFVVYAWKIAKVHYLWWYLMTHLGICTPGAVFNTRKFSLLAPQLSIPASQTAESYCS